MVLQCTFILHLGPNRLFNDVWNAALEFCEEIFEERGVGGILN